MLFKLFNHGVAFQVNINYNFKVKFKLLIDIFNLGLILNLENFFPLNR